MFLKKKNKKIKHSHEKTIFNVVQSTQRLCPRNASQNIHYQRYGLQQH